jgi:FtsH-binding integral membrane protein
MVSVAFYAGLFIRNEESMLSSPSTVLRSDSTFRSMLQQVYGWMAAGLALTGVVAWYVGDGLKLGLVTHVRRSGDRWFYSLLSD